MRRGTLFLAFAAVSAVLIGVVVYQEGIAPMQARKQAEKLAGELNLPLYVDQWGLPVEGLKAELSNPVLDPEPAHMTVQHNFYRGNGVVETVAIVDLLVGHPTDRERHAYYGDSIYSNECTIVNGAVKSLIVARRSDSELASDWDVEVAAGIDELADAHCTALLEAGTFKIPTIESFRALGQ